jgi:cytoplasmic iron level regulating protein YaaA (DUF328/UPF0246 family)
VLLLLPPSETKRDGGVGPVLDVGALAFPRLNPARAAVIQAVGTLSADHEASMAALGLGPRQTAEVERNRALLGTPTMAAADRYTGVLYDALSAATLGPDARAFADRHMLVHSALFGLVRALDPIPAYRLSHSSKLPGVALKKLWRQPVSAVLAEADELILDLRSEAYAALGPAPEGPGTRYLRVVAEDGAGHKRALNHFNKKSKGQFARAFALARPHLATIDELCEWAASEGFRLMPGLPGELHLVVSEEIAQRA